MAATTYVIKFDQKFQTGTVTCQGRIFPRGVDPFHRGAIPIANSEFTCPRDRISSYPYRWLKNDDHERLAHIG